MKLKYSVAELCRLLKQCANVQAIAIPTQAARLLFHLGNMGKLKRLSIAPFSRVLGTEYAGFPKLMKEGDFEKLGTLLPNIEQVNISCDSQNVWPILSNCHKLKSLTCVATCSRAAPIPEDVWQKFCSSSAQSLTRLQWNGVDIEFTSVLPSFSSLCNLKFLYLESCMMRLRCKSIAKF